jgi:hypothetical protein
MNILISYDLNSMNLRKIKIFDGENCSLHGYIFVYAKISTTIIFLIIFYNCNVVLPHMLIYLFISMWQVEKMSEIIVTIRCN